MQITDLERVHYLYSHYYIMECSSQTTDQFFGERDHVKRAILELGMDSGQRS